jgi:hypothetical protein
MTLRRGLGRACIERRKYPAISASYDPLPELRGGDHSSGGGFGRRFCFRRTGPPELLAVLAHDRGSRFQANADGTAPIKPLKCWLICRR